MTKESLNIFKLMLFVLLFGHSFLTQAQEVTSNIEVLKKQFEKNVTNVHQEKIFIHTDRNSYITGETIWFSAYCVDATIHFPSDISKVLNVEIVGKSGQSFSQERIILSKGHGNGQIFVSPEIPSGSYELRAYTNWMKNFDPEYIFKKKIKIVNPSANGLNITEDQSNVSSNIDFFPEGGDLVYGLMSRVAVKATDNNGDPLILSGLIYDDQNNEVSKFNTSKLGYTAFYLSPKEGKSYIAKVVQDSTVVTYKLPTPRASGLVLTVKKLESLNYKLSFQQSNGVDDLIYLIVHSRGLIRQIKKIDLSNSKEYELKSANLLEGISHVTIMNSQFVPLAERLIFKYPKEERKLEMKTDKQAYDRRNKVNILLNLNEEFLDADTATVSISVSKSEKQIAWDNDIVSNLLLTSDLKGYIPEPWTYFNPKNSIRDIELDLVLLANGWRRFDWKAITGQRNFEPKYPAEINSPIISGRVIPNNNMNLPGSIQMTFLSKSSVINSTDLDSDSIFHFEVPSRIKNEKVYFFINKDTLATTQVNCFSPFDLPKSEPVNGNHTFSPKEKSYLESLNSNIQTSLVYREFNDISGSELEVDDVKTHFYGVPDHEYILDNYTRFETVKDLFIEFIRKAIIRDNNRKKGFFVVNEHALPEKALTLIDGVPIFDLDYILKFDPLKFEKIDIVNDYYFIGGIRYAGLVNFTTYNGNFGEEELPSYLVAKAYHAIQQPKEFYAPDYSLIKGRLNRIPDYRSTLFWKSASKMSPENDLNLEFYTSDDTGYYEIVVNGITTSGIPIHQRTSFKVNKKSIN